MIPIPPLSIQRMCSMIKGCHMLLVVLQTIDDDAEYTNKVILGLCHGCQAKKVRLFVEATHPFVPDWGSRDSPYVDAMDVQIATYLKNMFDGFDWSRDFEALIDMVPLLHCCLGSIYDDFDADAFMQRVHVEIGNVIQAEFRYRDRSRIDQEMEMRRAKIRFVPPRSLA